MKLIKEINETVNYITEDADGKKELHIEGPFLVAEKKNRNGRLYEFNTMKKEVYRYTEDYINKNRAFGELGHPESPSINLDRVAILIKSLKEDGTQWIGKAKILETPNGLIARGLLEGGANLGVSSRAMGSLKQNNEGVQVVQDDFMLSTAADIVADPSAPDAYVRGIMENKEWTFVDGKFVEQNIEEVKSFIKKTSSRNLEEAKIRAFQHFLSKIR